MRFVYRLLWLAFVGACTPSEPAAVTTSACHYSSLSQVAAAPRRANGKTFCSDLYSYSKHGFLAFYDQPVYSTAEALRKEALLIGEEDATGNFATRYPSDGERVRVEGKLKLQMSCFSGTAVSCVPVSKPIYLDKPKLSVLAK
jgi:hypothetical protein